MVSHNRASGRKSPPPPLDAQRLERLALFYVGRYAVTRAKLIAYLVRKVRERGWEGEGAPQTESLADRFVALGYIDDAAFATARAGALGRRGYGVRRVDQALRADGIGEGDSAEALEEAREGAWAAALRFATRKRIGPFAAERPDRPGREKAFAAMLRAGHPMDLARRLIDAAPGIVPDEE